MVIIGAVNLVLGVGLYRKAQRVSKQEPQNAKYLTALAGAGLYYLTVACYRVVFVCSYPSRLAWFDSIFNSSFIIRCLATGAELAFIGSIALILLKMNKELGLSEKSKFDTWLNKTPYLAVLAIFSAQFLAFGGLITQKQLPFAVEESLWGFAFLIITPLIFRNYSQLKNTIADISYRLFLLIMMVWCVGYLSFQLLFALPFMYWPAVAAGATSLIPANALHSAIFDYTVTRDFNTWGGLGFFIWHSGYFSICAWMVRYFMSGPRQRNNGE